MQTAATGLELRQAREGDLERLLEIHASAFPDPRGVDERRTNFLANPLGTFDDLFAVVETATGAVLAHGFLFRLEVWFGGRPVPVSGIASVAVAPEARGRGVAAFLLEALQEVGRARGDALAMLYAFRYGFYVAHGYAAVTPAKRLVVSPRAIPKAFVHQAKRLGLRAAREGDRPLLESAYARGAARATGWLTRPQRFWDRWVASERRAFFVEPTGRGYVAWRLVQAEAHGPIHLVVDDLVADDPEARRALVGLVGAQRDQVLDAAMTLAEDDPLDRALVDADLHRFGDPEVEHAIGTLVGGPLVRLLDPVAALTARGYAAVTEELVLAIEAGTGAEPAVRLRLRLDVGRAAVTEERGPADYTCSRATLAQVALGALRPSDAVRLGLASAADDDALARVDRCLYLAPFHAVDAF